MRAIMFVSLLSVLLSLSLRQPAYVSDQVARSEALDSKLDPYSLKYQAYDTFESDSQVYATLPLATSL